MTHKIAICRPPHQNPAGIHYRQIHFTFELPDMGEASLPVPLIPFLEITRKQQDQEREPWQTNDDEEEEEENPLRNELQAIPGVVDVTRLNCYALALSKGILFEWRPLLESVMRTICCWQDVDLESVHIEEYTISPEGEFKKLVPLPPVNDLYRRNPTDDP